MEVYELIGIELAYRGRTIRLAFVSAELVVVADYGSALWYIDVSGIADEELLRKFRESEDIRVGLKTGTGSGEIFQGIGYFHPNEKHRAAAIRGEGELIRL